jgi:hypothetical protein
MRIWEESVGHQGVTWTPAVGLVTLISGSVRSAARLDHNVGRLFDRQDSNFVCDSREVACDGVTCRSSRAAERLASFHSVEVQCAVQLVRGRPSPRKREPGGPLCPCETRLRRKRNRRVQSFPSAIDRHESLVRTFPAGTDAGENGSRIRHWLGWPQASALAHTHAWPATFSNRSMPAEQWRRLHIRPVMRSKLCDSVLSDP